MQRPALVVSVWRHYRNFQIGELLAEAMLLEYGFVAPAPGAIELGHNRAAVGQAHLVDPVLVAVQREEPSVTPEPEVFHGVQDLVRTQVTIGLGFVGSGPSRGGISVHSSSVASNSSQRR